MQFLKPVGDSGFTFELAHSKTNQAGVERPENFKPVEGSAADVRRDWLQSAGITEGRLFRRIRKGDHLGEPLSPAAVRDIVLARCTLTGVTGEFSAHSLRSGFVSEAASQSAPLAETMAMTGHRSVQSVLGISRIGLGRGGASGLLDSMRTQFNPD